MRLYKNSVRQSNPSIQIPPISQYSLFSTSFNHATSVICIVDYNLIPQSTDFLAIHNCNEARETRYFFMGYFTNTYQ